MNEMNGMHDFPARHPRLLTLAEVAELRRVSRGYAYGLTRSGRLPAVRIGTGPRAPLRVDSDDLRAFLVAANADDLADEDEGA